MGITFALYERKDFKLNNTFKIAIHLLSFFYRAYHNNQTKLSNNDVMKSPVVNTQKIFFKKNHEIQVRK